MVRTAGVEPAVKVGDEPGSVVVAVPIGATVNEAWRALTEGDRVAQWFGVLSGELAPGATVRLDFEDGDFFDVEIEEVAKPVLRFSWRFMGCGACDTIKLRVDAREGGSVVTVIDSEPNRTREDVHEIGEGWKDFLERLQRYVSEGERTRYDWRSEIDVRIALPLDPPAARRLTIGSAAYWLPLEPGAANLVDASTLILDDGEEPAQFAISGLRGTGPASVEFDVHPADMLHSLPCSIAVAVHGDGSMLAIGHTGFRGLDADGATQRRLRERFAVGWLTAAHRARAIADGALADARNAT